MIRPGACLAVVAASALLAFSSAPAVAVAASPLATSTRVAISLPASQNPDLIDRLGEAAEDGDVDAMNLLGVLFVSGARVPSDYSMALYWFRRAVDAGSADGMYNLATMYVRGLGVAAPDYVNAFHWFLRGAEGGNAYAMFSVAAMAEHGVGAARDPALARRMYRKAAELGVPLAMLSLSDALRREGADQDLVEAHAWLDVAALAEFDGPTLLVVLARREDLSSRLDAAERDRARASAARIVAEIRARAARERSPSASTPALARRVPSA